MSTKPGGGRPRVAILKDAFIPEYRLRLYECLGQMAEIEYVVFHGEPPRATGHRAASGPFSFAQVPVRSRGLRLAGKTFVYQSAVGEIAGPGFDAAVIGAELKLLANAALFPLLKLRRRPVLLWGQGIDKQEDRGPVMSGLARGGARLRLAAARRADGYLVYTEGGGRRLIDLGVDPAGVFVLRNTLDVESEIELQRAAAGEAEGKLRDELGLKRDSIVLLFIGRVYREKRLSEFVSMLRALADRTPMGAEVEGLVVGDGPDLERVSKEARGLDTIHFLGEVREGERIARCMRVASALVIPGAVGLAVNHAFAHGVPVITRANPMQGPEFEYLEPGRNSIVADGDFGAFVKEVAAFVDAPARRQALADGALRARETLTVAAMAASFDRAVRSTLSATL
jgi:glycosyltransferase involved in cell wall biosynthesis